MSTGRRKAARTKRLRVGLNLVHALPDIGGVWEYMAVLLRAIARYDCGIDFVAFVTQQGLPLVPKQPNFKVVILAVDSRSRWQRVVWENTVLQYLAWRHRLDCMHWFANTTAIFNAVPAIVTVHDLQVYSAEWHTENRLKRTYLKFIMPRTVKEAKLLLPVSEATATGLHEVLGVDRKKMVVIPNMVDERFKPAAAWEVEQFRQKYHLPRKFWLYVANFYPHKNHLRLIEAYHLLIRKGGDPWSLVLRGDGDDKAVREIVDMVERLDISDKIVWLPRLDLHEMVLLYSAATALIFPSLYEGTGRPVLEAMACGCPVIASDIPAVREHADEAAVYFNPRDVNSIAEAMANFQKGEGYEGMRDRSLRRARLFLPDRVIPRLVESYERICRQRR